MKVISSKYSGPEWFVIELYFTTNKFPSSMQLIDSKILRLQFVVAEKLKKVDLYLAWNEKSM